MDELFEFQLYWNDLTEEAQKDLLENGFKYDDNMKVFPIVTIYQDTDLEGF